MEQISISIHVVERDNCIKCRRPRPHWCYWFGFEIWICHKSGSCDPVFSEPPRFEFALSSSSRHTHIVFVCLQLGASLGFGIVMFFPPGSPRTTVDLLAVLDRNACICSQPVMLSSVRFGLWAAWLCCEFCSLSARVPCRLFVTRIWFIATLHLD
jgi:hypothetical protein